MYDPTKFTLRNMTECGAELRKLGCGATSMEEVSNRIVHYLYTKFIDRQTGKPAFALVRFFKTHAYGQLEPKLQEVVHQTLGHSPEAQVKCLTLLATTGEHPNWQSRHHSAKHQAIPLLSERLVDQSPMISQLIKQFGLAIDTVLLPDAHLDAHLMVDLEQKTFNVFHVPVAIGSPYVPAQQDFVIPYGIQSVLGYGGMLPSGHLMAVILFSKLTISRDTADMFKTLALNTKMAVLPFDSRIIFSE
ncbi:MAG: hypothetical protein HC772_13470 [Leptolyngbyaceae cyanobacterium CRU_2_3]|nr:hypothetical protein [Leptolyngbyaceae cyanobacterium CRU_2_3]